MPTIKVDNVYKQNNAFSGFIIDKVYDTLNKAKGDIGNIQLGEYVLIRQGEQKEEKNTVYQKVLLPSSSKNKIELLFITSLHSLSPTEISKEITGFKEDLKDEVSELEEQVNSIKDTINITEENFDEIAATLATNLDEVISSYTLKWQTH